MFHVFFQWPGTPDPVPWWLDARCALSSGGQRQRWRRDGPQATGHRRVCAHSSSDPFLALRPHRPDSLRSVPSSVTAECLHPRWLWSSALNVGLIGGYRPVCKYVLIIFFVPHDLPLRHRLGRAGISPSGDFCVTAGTRLVEYRRLARFTSISIMDLTFFIVMPFDFMLLYAVTRWTDWDVTQVRCYKSIMMILCCRNW
jgi:hypothetical protein